MMMIPKSGTFESGGLALHYLEWGAPDAPPVVLLHGLRAYGQWFEEFCEPAAAHLRLIALDQRGRGRSAWAGPGEYTTDHYVADVHALAGALGLARFGLVGHSMGGWNAVAYAAKYPGQVRSLVIVDSAPELDPAGLARIKAELARTPQAFANLAEARAFLAGLHHRATPRSLETRLQWMLAPREDGTLGWRIDPRIFDPNIPRDPPERMWGELAALACPTLIVRGAITDIVTRASCEQMLAALKQGELVEIPRAGHMIVEDNPQDFNAAVIPFLARTMA
jgi:pimeloyl-ACP methyl ester carboxylesterase